MIRHLNAKPLALCIALLMLSACGGGGSGGNSDSGTTNNTSGTGAGSPSNIVGPVSQPADAIAQAVTTGNPALLPDAVEELEQRILDTITS